MTTWLVLLPPEAAGRMAAAGSGWGYMTMAVAGNHHLAAVTGVSDGNRAMYPAAPGLDDRGSCRLPGSWPYQ